MFEPDTPGDEMMISGVDVLSASCGVGGGGGGAGGGGGESGEGGEGGAGGGGVTPNGGSVSQATARTMGARRSVPSRT